MSKITISQAFHKQTVFPGGEVHVHVQEMTSRFDPVAYITAHLTDANGIMELLLVTDALRRANPTREIFLNLPYVPYARQDRVTDPGTAHSLKVFSTLINSQRYASVTIFDPHSDVCEAVFDRVQVLTNHKFVHTMLRAHHDSHKDLDNFVLVAPDAGATKKVNSLFQSLCAFSDLKVNSIVTCSKERDPVTGKLSGFSAPAGLDLAGQTCVIVDDICDGGGTFLGVADALRTANAGDLVLIVSHGIFSQGFDKLLEKYSWIGFSNSFKTHDIDTALADRLIQLPWKTGHNY